MWYQGKTSQYRCEDSWKKFFPYCPSFYKMMKENTLQDFIESRTQAMNAALVTLVDKWNRDSKSNAFQFLTQVPGTELRPEFFSVDCYHMGPYGQTQFAESVFHAAYF